MNKKAIVKAINESYYEPELEGYTIVQIKEIGGEGDGAPLSFIFEAKEEKTGETALFRLDGYYSSWDCSSFDDDAYEVEEYIKQVKDWRKV